MRLARALRMHLGRVLEMAESSDSQQQYERKIVDRFGGSKNSTYLPLCPAPSCALLRDLGALLGRKACRPRRAALAPQFDRSGVLAIILGIGRLPGSDVDDQLPELDGIAGALFAGRGHARVPPLEAGRLVVLGGGVCSADWPLAGAGASATVSLSLAFSRLGRHLQSRLG